MTEQTRAEKEMAVTMVSIALWGTIVLFVVVGILFLLDIIPSGNGTLIGLAVLGVAFLDWVIIKTVVAKMHADLEDE